MLVKSLQQSFPNSLQRVMVISEALKLLDFGGSSLSHIDRRTGLKPREITGGGVPRRKRHYGPGIEVACSAFCKRSLAHYQVSLMKRLHLCLIKSQQMKKAKGN